LAHAALSEAASRTDVARIEREYFDLFIGLGRGELLPYGSYYLTGFLHERPLARLRAKLASLGIERSQGIPEPEDHAAILLEIMSGLVSGRFAVPAGSDRDFFAQHVAPWIGAFFGDLEGAQGADFYRRVGALGRLFVDIEKEAFALPAWVCAHASPAGDEEMKKQQQAGVRRREFLRTFGAGATAAVATAGPLSGTARADSETNDEKRKSRYKETEHVKTFYRVNRYPS
jgi:TorA maturation chaperone TorD